MADAGASSLGQQAVAEAAAVELSVIVPTFNDASDGRALGILQELFRNRPVIGIHAVDLVLGFGTLHCLTREQPLP